MKKQLLQAFVIHGAFLLVIGTALHLMHIYQEASLAKRVQEAERAFEKYNLEAAHELHRIEMEASERRLLEMQKQAEWEEKCEMVCYPEYRRFYREGFCFCGSNIRCTLDRECTYVQPLRVE